MWRPSEPWRRVGKFAGRVWSNPVWDVGVMYGAARGLRRNMRTYQAGGRPNPMDTAINTGFGVASAYSLGAAGKRGYALIKSGAARKAAVANWQKVARLAKLVR